MLKHIVAVFVGTLAGQLLWDRVIKPKMDGKDKK